MRTIIELSEAQVRGLSGYCQQKGISRSQAIRDAVTELLKEKGVSERSRAFGIWKGKKIKSREWVEAIRGEWHPA
jgi:metal-responsive CopG/Arc/MetJ family transcriptional regulator